MTDFDKWLDESHPNGWDSPDPKYKTCEYCAGEGVVDDDDLCEECSGEGEVEMTEEEVYEESIQKKIDDAESRNDAERCEYNNN